MHRRQAITLAAFLCIWIGGYGRVYAQATTGSIAGRVTDPSHALVPQAVVKVRDEATGLAQETRTNASGEYTLAALPPGSYTLSVNKEGFKAAVVAGIPMTIDARLRLDVELKLGVISAVETVTSQAPILQQQSAETGELIESRQILNLPLLGRNFLNLARLTAGIGDGGGGNNLNLASNGQREFANSILIDGVEVSGNRNNDTSIRPSVDSVEQFKAVTSGYPAELGRASGAVIAIQTRSGSNQLHGDLYEFFRPNSTAARSFFSTRPAELKQHNFGGVLGGPVRKNKTFFFASYEGTRLRDGFSYLDSVPPAGQIQFQPGGNIDLSGLKDPSTGKQTPIFDPDFYGVNFYAQQFPGNVIPASRVSAAGRKVLQNLFPAPTRAGILNGWFSNFDAHQSYLFDADTLDGRIDHVFSERHRLSGAYHYGSFMLNLGDRFAGHIPVAGGGDADSGDHENSRNQSLSIVETRLLSSHWVNEVRFGYTRSRLDQLSLLDGQNLADQFGMRNVNLPGFPQTSGLPDIFLGFGASAGGSTYKPLHFLDSNYQLGEAVSARLGRHDFKAGVQYRHLSSHPFFSLFPTGFQYYGGSGLSLTSDPNYSFYDASAFYYNGGSDVADLLLGLPYTVNLGQQLTNPETRSWEGSGYAQDTWQVTPNLSLSYGLRYEYFSPWTEASNHTANFNVAAKQLLLAGRGGNSSALVEPDRNNFAPRVGVAWRIAPRTVVRGAWGMFYSPENDAREDVLTKNYPFAVEQTVFNNIFNGLPFPYVLDAGVARTTFIPIPAGVSSLSAARQNVFAVDPAMRTGYAHLYNVTVERELASNFSVEAGYVGSVSRELPYAVGNLNLNNRITADAGQVQAQFSEGEANFQSLQIKAERRFARQSFQAAYTFGKNLDNGPAPFNLGHNQNSHNQPQDALQLALEHAPADNDVRHNLVASYTYELPFFRRRRWLGGWQVNGIFAARSGLPVNVVRNPQDTGYEGLRPDVTRDPNLSRDARSLTAYFDTSAFSKTRFTGSHKHDLGNAGRNLVRGPGLVNLDFSAFKEVPVRERTRLQLRFEFFNFTNTPHFANPVGSMSDGRFGSIAQTIANPRVVQFAAKLNF
jgi:hypothetical protein